jgi:hypothetical protein
MGRCELPSGHLNDAPIRDLIGSVNTRAFTRTNLRSERLRQQMEVWFFDQMR